MNFRSLNNNYQRKNSIIDLSLSLEKQHIDSNQCHGDTTLPKPMQLFSDEVENEDYQKIVDKYSFNQDYHVQQVLPNGWQLFDHQLHAINECLRLKRVILAFDMGLGKTIIALSWAKAVSRSLNYTCLTVVISPCTLIDNWKREASVLDFQVMEKSNHQSKSNSSTVVFASWAKVPDISTINKHLGQLYHSFIVIADEAHAIQNFRSQRTQALLQLTSQRHVRPFFF
jgi:SNF2 family DNA or RNA helicase